MKEICSPCTEQDFVVSYEKNICIFLIIRIYDFNELVLHTGLVRLIGLMEIKFQINGTTLI